MPGLMRGRSVVDRHDYLFYRKRGSNLACRVAFELLALGESLRGHVVFHHGAFFQFMPNGVHMIGADRLEKLLKVIDGLSPGT
jgi:hypothetical protein